MVAGPYILAAAYKEGAADAPISIYIEGDGRAFAPTGGVSDNPTPANPVGLELALADAGGGPVLYVARPCQFVEIKTQRVCSKRAIFTDLRWSEQVVEAYRVALQPYIEQGQGIRLVGYSGGAYIALAVAGRLPHGAVREIATYAGNLNPHAVHRMHGIKVLEGVVPLDYGVLAAISQTHYVGSKDRVIKPAVREAYVAEAGEAGRAAVAAGRWRWVEVEAGHEWK